MFRKIAIGVFSTAITALFLSANGCDSGGSGVDPVTKDAQAASQISQISTSIRNRKAISTEEFAALKQLHDRFPRSDLVRRTYFEALIVRGDVGSLEKVLTERSIAALSQKAKLDLAKIFKSNGKYAECIDILLPLAEKDPENSEIVGLLGVSYFHLDEPEKAAPFFDRVWPRLVADKRFEEITIRGLIHFRNNDLTRALEVLKLSREINPDQVAVNNALSRIYARLGDKEKADSFRRITVAAQDSAVSELNRASRNVENIIELENEWKNKNFSRVIELSRLLLPGSSPDQRTILYQYILEAGRANGDTAAAKEAMNELQNLQKR